MIRTSLLAGCFVREKAAFAVYAWKSDLSNEEILEKLLELNLGRAG